MAKAKRTPALSKSYKQKNKPKFEASKPFLIEKDVMNPSLAFLFASSAGPLEPPSKSRYSEPQAPFKKDLLRGIANIDSDVKIDPTDQGNEDLSSSDGDLEGLVATELEDVDASSQSSNPLGSLGNPLKLNGVVRKNGRKRKRHINGDDLEGSYMLRIAKEEEEERQAKRHSKRSRLVAKQDGYVSEEDLNNEDSEEFEGPHGCEAKKEDNKPPQDVPQHESLAPDKNAIELEKSQRTVFLANISTAAITDKKAKKSLFEHMTSFIDLLPPPGDGESKHKIESIRFRSTAYTGGGMPKKAAYATKALMDATTKSTNAYLIYSTALAAREAVKRLNGTMILDRHLRVDGVAHPAKTDHRRCVFVGNLGFVDDETLVDQGGKNERQRSKIPSDVEEGLWRQFGKAGTVESVRVVRDEKTRVGKGFAYVQFQDVNSVEAALLFHDKKFPPMLPRVLRVTRAKAVKKTALASHQASPSNRPLVNSSSNPNRERIYNPKMSSQQQSLKGRVARLLGRVGASQFKRYEKLNHVRQPMKGLEGIAKTAESVIFEGFRASEKSGKPKDLKLGGGGKKKGKPKNRGARRASEWRKAGGKTTR